MLSRLLFYRSSSLASGWASTATAPAVAVQTIDIACSLARTLDFISDARQWLPWAIPELQAVQPLPFGQWLLTATDGLRKLRLRPGSTPGTLLFEVVNPATGTWPIPVYLRPTATGCQVVITFRQPAHVPTEAFKTFVCNARNRLAMFRLALEQD